MFMALERFARGPVAAPRAARPPPLPAEPDPVIPINPWFGRTRSTSARDLPLPPASVPPPRPWSPPRDPIPPPKAPPKSHPPTTPATTEQRPPQRRRRSGGFQWRSDVHSPGGVRWRAYRRQLRGSPCGRPWQEYARRHFAAESRAEEDAGRAEHIDETFEECGEAQVPPEEEGEQLTDTDLLTVISLRRNETSFG